ncbi:Pkinase-domain-containing protein [Auriscalpium vulgare]|uniref:Pkinase-domain-containing protein n=1 Tax=Auriscalpium vulgare TaxID=40419 RepID=A0ACB8RUM5_9AGAM|nr:Pkinase-domain-containing protein [Auriscalpium vulgare]
MDAPSSPQYNEQDYTQAEENATQLASQSYDVHPMESHLFGCLVPLDRCVTRVDLLKLRPTTRFGRGEAPHNDIIFPSLKISFNHCRIEWNGKEGAESIVTVIDLSTNGTYINERRIGKNNSAILRDSNVIAFGTPVKQNDNEDYRFLYRDLASPVELDGVYAKYDMSHELGAGTFATVMSAIERATGETWAVKVIHGAKMRGNDPAKIQNFQREIAILESLDHPSICRLKETFFGGKNENNDIFLVLEYIPGGDLLDYILKRNGLKEDEARKFTRQMCDALSYIHGRNITHRDLKPENILMTGDDDPDIKVADFGLAKAVDSLTMLRTMCGTPSYLAPEVVNQTNTQGYDHLVDSWSVGVIVFSMLTNSTPFLENADLEIRQRIAERTIEWSSLTENNVSPAAIDFIRRLLDTDPTTRMTLTNALEHPWLAEPAARPIPRSLTEISEESIDYSDTRVVTGEGSMLSALPSDGDIPVAGVNSLTLQSSPQRAGPVGRVGSRARLERRSQVLALAEQQESQRDISASPENSAVDATVVGKRAREQPGSPMDAIDEADEPEPQAKRGRRADDELPRVPAPRKKNPRAGPPQPVPTQAPKRTRANGVPPHVEDDTAVRRSPRTAASRARR